MSQAKQYVYPFKELAELLVKREDLHEGHWGLFVKFGIQGANISRSEAELLPAAIVPILEFGIQRFDEPNPLTIDAAVVNRKPRKKTKSAKSKR